MEHQFHLPISLNISAPHLQPGFADWMAQKLADHPIGAPGAVVEIR